MAAFFERTPLHCDEIRQLDARDSWETLEARALAIVERSVRVKRKAPRPARHKPTPVRVPSPLSTLDRALTGGHPGSVQSAGCRLGVPHAGGRVAHRLEAASSRLRAAGRRVDASARPRARRRIAVEHPRRAGTQPSEIRDSSDTDTAMRRRRKPYRSTRAASGWHGCARGCNSAWRAWPPGTASNKNCV